MTTDGVSHTGVRLIDPRKAHSDAAHVADVARMALAGAYAHEQFAYATLVDEPFLDHFTQQRDAGEVSDTDLTQVGTYLAFLPLGIKRIVVEIAFVATEASNLVAQVQLKLNDAASGAYAATYTSSIYETAVELDDFGIGRARAIYIAENDGQNPPIDGGLIRMFPFFATVDNSTTPVAVTSRPVHVTIWTEAV